VDYDVVVERGLDGTWSVTAAERRDLCLRGVVDGTMCL
jgi:hypothetical protein